MHVKLFKNQISGLFWTLYNHVFHKMLLLDISDKIWCSNITVNGTFSFILSNSINFLIPFRYVFAITNETDVSIKKMRVVIAQEKLLKSIHDGTVNQPEFGMYSIHNNGIIFKLLNIEHVYGEIRWNTVKLMSKMYHEQYDSIMESK